MDKNNFQFRIKFRQKIILMICSIFFCIFILEIGLRLSGAIFLSLQSYKNRLSLRQKGAYRIMCLGESTTALNDYPLRLEKVSNERDNKGVKFSVINKGIPATNTSAMLSQLEENLNRYKPDMVITMIGINDRGIYIPYEDTHVSKTVIFLRSFRTYKLARLLWLHAIAKIKEWASIGQKNKAERLISAPLEYSNIGLKKQNIEEEDLTQTEEAFKKAIELNPGNDTAFLQLGLVYRSQGETPEVEKALKEAIRLNPKNEKAYTALALIYRKKGTSQAEDLLQKAIELNPKESIVYLFLASHYTVDREKYTQGEELLENFMKQSPEDDRIYGAAEVICGIMGKYDSAKEYHKKANNLRTKYYLPTTVHNYQKLKNILDKKGIKLVCMQYPIRNIKPLKKIFEGQRGIIFVDNERIFKKAVEKGSYKEYFTDMFGGDFGHCTHKGNELLAENIADTLLKQCF